jgi:hypothetical protein
MFALHVKNAYKAARDSAKARPNPDPGPLEEMAEMSRLFPGFGIVKKVPFSLRLGEYRWRIENLLAKYLNVKKS